MNCLWTRRLMLSFGLMLLVGLSINASAQQAAATAALAPGPTRTQPTSVADDDRYRIGPGDVLDIRIYNRPNLSRDGVRVEGNGMKISNERRRKRQIRDKPTLES